MKTLLAFRRPRRADKHVDRSAFRIRISPCPIGVVHWLELQPDPLGNKLENIGIDTGKFTGVFLKTERRPIRIVTHTNPWMRFDPGMFTGREDKRSIWWNNFLTTK